MKSICRNLLILIVIFSMCLALAAGEKKFSYKPKNGFVPDRVTAINIAIAVLSPIYGENRIKSEEPFVVSLDENMWTVAGSLPRGVNGGVAEIEISKETGQILRVSHGK